MTKPYNRIAILACALLSTGILASSAQAATSLATGGYSREFQKMGMMKMLDENGDHQVSSNEFTDYFTLVFDELDTNRDGSLDTREWVGTKGSQEISLATGGFSRELRTLKMMGMMDSDGDHRVAKEEFLNYQQRVYNTMAGNANTIDPQNWLRRITQN